jgi:hypothetical protein
VKQFIFSTKFWISYLDPSEDTSFALGLPSPHPRKRNSPRRWKQRHSGVPRHGLLTQQRTRESHDVWRGSATRISPEERCRTRPVLRAAAQRVSRAAVKRKHTRQPRGSLRRARRAGASAGGDPCHGRRAAKLRGQQSHEPSPHGRRRARGTLGSHDGRMGHAPYLSVRRGVARCAPREDDGQISSSATPYEDGRRAKELPARTLTRFLKLLTSPFSPSSRPPLRVRRRARIRRYAPLRGSPGRSGA